MSASVYAISFFILGLTTGIFGSYAFFRSFNKVNNNVNLLFAFGIILIGIAYAVAFSLGLISPYSEDLAKKILATVNGFLTVGLLFIALSLFYVNRETFEITGTILSFLAGIMFITVSDPRNINVNYSHKFGYWTGDYTSRVETEISVIILILILLVTLYLYKKIYYSIKRRRLSLSVIGILGIVFWLLTIGITSLYYIRVFVLCISLIVISVENLKNPLSLLVVSTLPEEIILYSRTNMPLLQYSTKSKKINDDVSEFSLLRICEMLLDEKIRANSLFYSFRAKRRGVATLKAEGFIVTFIGDIINHNIRSAIIFALKEFSKKVNFDLLISSGMLKRDEESWFKESIERSFELICANF